MPRHLKKGGTEMFEKKRFIEDCRAALTFLKRPNIAHDAVNGNGVTVFVEPPDLDAGFWGFHRDSGYCNMHTVRVSDRF